MRISGEMSLLSEGKNGWEKYNILPWFALSMGTSFNSNSETEHAFSVETDIHRDPKSGEPGQLRFSHACALWSGRQKKLRIMKCCKHKTAKTKIPHHCHWMMENAGLNS